MRRCSASLSLPHSYCPLLSVSSYFSCALFQRCFWAKFRTLHSAQEQWLFWSMWARKKRKGTQIVKESKIHPWLLSPRERKSDRQELFPSNSSFTSPICKERGSLPIPWQTWLSLPLKKKKKNHFSFSMYTVTQFGDITTCTGIWRGVVRLMPSSTIPPGSPFAFTPVTGLSISSVGSAKKQVTFNFGLRDKPISSPYGHSFQTYPKSAHVIYLHCFCTHLSPIIPHLVDYDSVWTVLSVPTLFL